MVEILIVFVIISVLAVVSWGSLAGSRKKADAINACTQVAAAINKARNYAVSGKVKASDGPVNISINGKTISITGFGLNETITLSGQASCGVASFSYSAPDAIGSSGNVNCTTGSDTRTVAVTPYKATCQ